MMLVDSHCHLDQLDLSPYAGDLGQALAYAETKAVQYYLCVCITLEHFPAVLQIAHTYPQVSASVGLHPDEKTTHEPDAAQLFSLAEDKKVVAIGETGLDYFRTTGETEWQRERFRQHIRAARAAKKPLIIHTRQAKEDTLRIMREERAGEVGGVMHCFTEDLEMAKAAMDLNFYISFSGIVTFKNAVALQTVAQHVPLDHMLIETDAPYLAPLPFRGKPNEPAYVYYVAEAIAKLRGIAIEDVALKTTANYFNLFKNTREGAG